MSSLDISILFTLIIISVSAVLSTLLILFSLAVLLVLFSLAVLPALVIPAALLALVILAFLLALVLNRSTCAERYLNSSLRVGSLTVLALYGQSYFCSCPVVFKLLLEFFHAGHCLTVDRSDNVAFMKI